MSLTFDDGPWPESTAQVLALLSKYHVRATFCVIGRNALLRPGVVRKEVREGHALCDHSRDHDLHMSRRSSGYQRGEVNDGLRNVREVVPDAAVRFYRQPGGSWDTVVVQAAEAAGLDPLRWSDDPRDWSRPGVTAIAQRVLLRLRPGAVVLLHDGGGDRLQTVQALAWLLPHLQAAGWTFTLPRPQHLPLEQAARPE